MTLARLLAAAAPFALLTTSAAADPITFTVLSVTITINVAAIAASLALSVVSNLLMRKKQRTPEQQRKLNPIEAAPVHRYACGLLRLGGHVVAREVVGRRLYLGLKMQDRASEGPFELHLDGRHAPFQGDPYDFEGPGAEVYDPTPGSEDAHDLLAGHVRLWIGRGDQTSVPARLLAECPRLARARPRPGRTVLWLALEHGDSGGAAERWPNGQPNATLTGRWSRIWDLRDPAQAPDDPSTWRWSANQALVLLDMLRHEDCLAVPLARIDLDSFRRGADICGEPIPLRAGGTEPRYEAHHLWEANGEQTPLDALQPVLAAGMSQLQEIPRGHERKLVYLPGLHQAPSLVLTEKHFAEADLTVTTQADPHDMANGARFNFLSPARLWEMTPLPPFQSVEALETDGGRESWLSEDLKAVTSPGQAARIQKRSVLLTRRERMIEAEFQRPALLAHAGATIRLDCPTRPLLDGVFTVLSWGLKLVPRDEKLGVYGLRVAMKLREAGPEDDVWSPLEEPEIEASPEIEGLLPTAAPRDLAAVPELIATGDGSTIMTARVSALPPQEAGSVDYYALRWARVLGPDEYGDWINGAPIPADQTDEEGRVFGRASPLTAGWIWRFQMSAVAGRSRSDWAEIERIMEAPGPPPAAPAALGAVLVEISGAQVVETRWRAPDEEGVRKLKLYSGPTPDFAGAALLDELHVSSGEAAAYYDPDLAPGETRHYRAVALDKWGKASAPSEAQAATRPL